MPAKRKNDFLQERVVLSFDHAAATADATTKLFKVPAGRKLKIDAVDYINPTGLAADATNAFIVKLLKGSTVVASWSTLTGAEGAIAANTFVSLVLSATAADLTFDAADIMSLFLDEQADTTLPAGRVVVHARYVQ